MNFQRHTRHEQANLDEEGKYDGFAASLLNDINDALLTANPRL